MACARMVHAGKARQLTMLAALAVALSPGCRSVTPEVTAVRVITTWPSSTTIDQLAFELYDDQGAMLGDRELRPAAPSSPLSSGTDLVVYLRDAFGGRSLRLVVAGLAHRHVVASGEREVAVTRSQVMEVVIPLGSEGGDGGTDLPTDAGDAAGDHQSSSETGADSGKRAMGEVCDVGTECASGNCVDRVCCASASCGVCRGCNVPSAVGRCHDLPAGAPEPAGGCARAEASSCGLDGKCDGSGACRKYPSGTVCNPASCHSNGEDFTRADLCDGKGVCVNQFTQDCGLYVCDAKNLACFTACTTDAQCVTGRRCRSGKCE